MKTNNDWTFRLLAVALMVGGLSFNSCKKDEVEPISEIVENPLEKEGYISIKEEITLDSKMENGNMKPNHN